MLSDAAASGTMTYIGLLNAVNTKIDELLVSTTPSDWVNMPQEYQNAIQQVRIDIDKALKIMNKGLDEYAESRTHDCPMCGRSMPLSVDFCSESCGRAYQLGAPSFYEE